MRARDRGRCDRLERRERQAVQRSTRPAAGGRSRDRPPASWPSPRSSRPSRRRRASATPAAPARAAAPSSRVPSSSGNGNRGYAERRVYPGETAGAAAAARSAAEPRARRRLRWWTIPLAVAAVLLAAVLVWGILGYRAFASGVAVSNKKVDAHTRAVLSPAAGSILTNPTTILVLGVDQRAGEPARSDTIMLMRFNPKTHSIAQLSIPRDMLVSIPGNGQSKINAAYAWGGAALSVRTVRQFTGIPVNHVMIVNMRGFPAMIDAVGGVDVYVPKTISSWYTGGRTLTFKRGWNHMDGVRAEQYVRMRKVDSDFFRMARQQQVVQALQKKVAARGNIPRLPWTGKEMVRRIGTDLSARQLIELAYLKWRTSAEPQLQARDAGHVDLHRRRRLRRVRQDGEPAHDQALPQQVGRPRGCAPVASPRAFASAPSALRRRSGWRRGARTVQ